jgi:glycosyltransferase involved in cell wall biosynthesis
MLNSNHHACLFFGKYGLYFLSSIVAKVGSQDRNDLCIAGFVLLQGPPLLGFSGKKVKKILVIGQTPPPFAGQAMMIQRLVSANYPDIEIHHVRMAFSGNAKTIGRFQVRKIFHMFYIVVTALRLRLKHKISAVYYPPAGPNLVPILRDLIILSLVRPFFRKTVFHFRAAGISDYLNERNWLKKVAKCAYRMPDVSIQLSNLNPADGEYFNSGKTVVIKNGLEDMAVSYLPINRSGEGPIRLLYVGNVLEDKGIRELVYAARSIKEMNIDFRLNIVGGFGSERFEEEMIGYCDEHNLAEYISFDGVKLGDEKWAYYAQADVFCFPSYFASESFGNVVVEAMMFELPVVATYWRGIPDIVDVDDTGYLVPIKDSAALYEKILLLINDSHLRGKMGSAGRKKFLKDYTLESHLAEMKKVILDVL